jgi:hypothetical protein
MTMLAWVIFGAIVVAVGIGLFLYWRSLSKWREPPPGPGDQSDSTLTWMTFSQGDQSGGV